MHVKIYLANTPLQEVTTFYMFNEKQKDDRMDKTQSPVFMVTM